MLRSSSTRAIVLFSFIFSSFARGLWGGTPQRALYGRMVSQMWQSAIIHLERLNGS